MAVSRSNDWEVHVIQTLAKNWWLLALTGILEAMLAGMYFFMRRPDGSLTLRTSGHPGTLVHLGMLTLAAGVCTIAAGIWSSQQGKSWLLVLNGLAGGTLGLILILWAHRPIAFGTIALLIVVMAAGIGVFGLVTARKSLRQLADQWFLSLAGAAAVCFALAFVAFVFHWIRLEPGAPAQGLRWLGSYYGFSALCKLSLAVRLRRIAP
jgi:uncharacterized membrane protein HdeD (DUF308 family)